MFIVARIFQSFFLLFNIYSPISLRKAVDKQGNVTFGTSIKNLLHGPENTVQLTLKSGRNTQLRTCTITILVIFSCFWNTTENKKTHKTFISITNCQYIRYNIIWGIVFPEYFNQKLFLFVDFYLSPDKLARKIYFSGRFSVRVRRVGHGNSTPLTYISHWLDLQRVCHHYLYTQGYGMGLFVYNSWSNNCKNVI